MNQAGDSSNAVVHPPIAWALAFVTGLGFDWLLPLRFVPASLHGGWIGGAVFGVGLLAAIWAVATIRRVGTAVRIDRPTTAIVVDGPYGFSRNPIYVGILLAQAGLAIGLDNLWQVVMLLPLGLVIRYGVIAGEEAYLERKFAGVYLNYKAAVRRWL